MPRTTPRRRSRLRRFFLFVLPATVVVLVLVAAFAFWFLLARFLRPAETGRLDEFCTALRHGVVNSYVYVRGGSAIAIDAGTDAEQTAAEYRRAGIDPAVVRAVFLTHSDSDHAGGMELFKTAVLYMGEAESGVVTGTTPRRILGLPFSNRFDRPWMPVRDDEVISVGAIAVRAVHTPGHSPGSTSYIVDGTHVFTGDLLMLRDGRAVVSERILNNDSGQSARSLRALARRVSGTGLTLLGTAHSGVSRDPEVALAPWR